MDRDQQDRETKERIAGVFSRAAATYDRIGPQFFSHFGRRLVELAHIPGDAAVLDVACGRGAALLPAAEQVGQDGRVVGVDIASGMVSRTSAEVERAGLKNVELFEMDAERLEFPEASFDCVLCGFSIFFFPNLWRGLGEFHRVLKAGGRLGVTTFAEENEFLDWTRSVVKPYLPPPEPQDQEEESPAFDTPQGLRELLSRADFEAIEVRAEAADFVYAGEEEWWSSLWSHGLRRALESMDPATRERFKTDAFREIQAFKGRDGIQARFGVLFAFGTKTRGKLEDW